MDEGNFNVAGNLFHNTLPRTKNIAVNQLVL